jgi:alkylated DNA nucleotide flippase Atl1
VDYVEQVLRAVEAIPPGQVCAYSDIAELVGWGGPRRVGQVMSGHGAAVPWWRVVRADGRPVRGLEEEALSRLRAEGVPLRGDRVDMARARFDFTGHPALGDTP